MSHKNFKDLSGKRFGHWFVINRGPNSGEKTRYFCVCDCGKEVLVYGVNLTCGYSTSCLSCAQKRRECFHGMSNSKTYSVYIQMVERCHNPSHKFYPYYGGRGIYVCDHWKDGFKNFLKDMGEVPEGLSIDRIDNEKGYSKENCQWTTRKEQQRNRRNSIKIGEIHNGWEIVSRSDKHKTYVIQCIECKKNRDILSCNFRRKYKCECNNKEET